MATTTQAQPTMTDLMQHVGNDSDITVGDVIKGKIISVTKNEVLLDIEDTGLGIVRGKEIFNEEFIARLKPGEEIEAAVLDLDNELGMFELSFRAIGRDKIWAEVTKTYEDQVTVEAKVRDANRGGFLVRIQGIEGFLPASLLSPTHSIKSSSIEDKSVLNQMKKFVGQTFNVKILSVNPDNDSFIASEKAVSDEIALEKLSKYKIGDIIDGVVVGTVDFGIFVRFDTDLEGLVHISELAWKKIEDPRQYYKLNDKVKAKIVDIDGDNRINLSIKQLQPNPWVNFTKTHEEGQSITAIVSRIVSYGAIVSTEDDIQGLCHITQMSKNRLDSPAKIHEMFTVGESYEFSILSMDQDEKLLLTRLDMDAAREIQEDQRQIQASRQSNVQSDDESEEDEE